MNKVTSIEELKSKAGAQVVELPGFTKDSTVFFEVKRPSILGLCAKGLIPNTLLSSAEEMFTGKRSGGTNGKGVDMKDMGTLMEILVSEALVNPSYEELKANGIELTDEQVTELFNYTQKGVTQLKLFREEQERAQGDSTSKDKQG